MAAVRRAYRVPMRLFSLVVLTVLFCGCSGIPDEDEAVRVDSFARDDAANFKTFRIISGSADLPQASLEFQDMAASLLPVLTKAGLIEWEAAKGGAPDILIAVDWLTPQVKTFSSTRNVPIVALVGGNFVAHYDTSVVNGRLVTSSGSSYSVPTLGIVGSSTETETTRIVSGGIRLVAYESAAFMAPTPQRDISSLQVWSLLLSHISEQPRIDVRKAYPEYLRTAAAYIGKSSHGQLLLALPKFAH